MPEIDADSLLLATKIISVIFVSLISLANGLLIFKIVKKPQFYLSPKFLVLISLAIGDIFHGIYSMLVYALIAYNEIDTDQCSTIITAQFYHEFVISFAFGVGVILLAFELLIRPKLRTASSSKLPTLIGLVLSALPWVLTLGFVLPLTMTGIDWDTCRYSFSESRLRAMFWLTDIVPPVMAVVVCFMILCIKSIGTQTQGTVINNFSNSGYGNTNPLYTYPNQQPIPQQHPDASNKLDSNSYHPQAHYYNHAPQQNCHNNEQQVVFSVTQPLLPNIVFQENPVQEKTILVSVAFTYLACVLPYGALAVSDGTLSYFTAIVLQQTFFWLLTFRSFVTPYILLSRK